MAGGFFVQEQSVRGAGRAFSGEAADRGLASLWWNPAAIARSGRELHLGLHLRSFDTSQFDEASTITRPIAPGGLTLPVGGDPTAENTTPDHVIPNLGVSLPVGERFALGLSATRAFYLENEFGGNSWARYDTIRNHIHIDDYQLTGAFRATSWLDLGVGISAQYTDAGLDSASPNLDPRQPDAIARLQAGDDWSYGFSLGAQAEWERFSFGASYRSAHDRDLEGSLSLTGLQGPLAGANFAAPAVTNFGTPWIAVVAGRYRATPELTLNAQLQRFGWSEYDVITIEFAGMSSTIPQDFEDVTTAAVGADYAVSEALTLRAGASYDPTPSPDTLRENGVADSDRWLYGAGASVRLRPGVTLDGALSYSRFEGSRIIEDALFYGGSGADTGVRIRGRFEGDAASASLALRVVF
ncbi:MAG: outer membrane protein transport protein [Proteobacteria bacterium]|nr:outer membrane protein transport protein [Pseudomonadota bacterium]